MLFSIRWEVWNSSYIFEICVCACADMDRRSHSEKENFQRKPLAINVGMMMSISRFWNCICSIMSIRWFYFCFAIDLSPHRKQLTTILHDIRSFNCEHIQKQLLRIAASYSWMVVVVVLLLLSLSPLIITSRIEWVCKTDGCWCYSHHIRCLILSDKHFCVLWFHDSKWSFSM